MAAVAATYYLSGAAGEEEARAPGRRQRGGGGDSLASSRAASRVGQATRSSVDGYTNNSGNSYSSYGGYAMQRSGSLSSMSHHNVEDQHGHGTGGRVPLPGARSPQRRAVSSMHGGYSSSGDAATHGATAGHATKSNSHAAPYHRAIDVHEAAAHAKRSHLRTAPDKHAHPAPRALAGAGSHGSHGTHRGGGGAGYGGAAAAARKGSLAGGGGGGGELVPDRRAMESAHFEVTGTLCTDGRYRGYAQVDVSFQSAPTPLPHDASSSKAWGKGGVGPWGADDSHGEAGAGGASGWGWGGGFSSAVPAPPRARSVLGGGGSGDYASSSMMMSDHDDALDHALGSGVVGSAFSSLTRAAGANGRVSPSPSPLTIRAMSEASPRGNNLPSLSPSLSRGNTPPQPQAAAGKV
jgi:hypothetical protein